MKSLCSVVLHPRIGLILKHEITEVDEITRVVVNGGGGMGGSRVEYFGNVAQPDELGMITVTLEISQRIIELNPRYIGEMEQMMLWKEVAEHKNENFSSPIVSYFVTNTGTKITMGKRQDSDLNAEIVFGLIDKEYC